MCQNWKFEISLTRFWNCKFVKVQIAIPQDSEIPKSAICQNPYYAKNANPQKHKSLQNCKIPKMDKSQNSTFRFCENHKFKNSGFVPIATSSRFHRIDTHESTFQLNLPQRDVRSDRLLDHPFSPQRAYAHRDMRPGLLHDFG